MPITDGAETGDVAQLCIPTFCHRYWCKHHPKPGGGAGVADDEVTCYSERRCRYVGVGGARVKADCGNYERKQREATDGDD